uniref:Mandelate racemase/muconate lactonizing enzyme C-terminal domain-containing protein n=1 Tax=Amphiprion ocellaris TaxID=80972 RepID=A0AAQ5XVS8_AMPOC
MLHKIINLTVRDVRFPTSLEQHGSDAMHSDPDYSAAYVVLDTDCGLKGFGLTFTLGKGTEIVVCAVKALAGLVVGKSLQEIVSNFRGFYRLLTSDGQMRWLGPEKGVIHLATAAVLNAVWDLWARAEGKPLWKLLVDMVSHRLFRPSIYAPGSDLEGNMSSRMCQSRIQSGLCRASTSDTSPTCSQRMKLWVRQLYDVQYTSSTVQEKKSLLSVGSEPADSSCFSSIFRHTCESAGGQAAERGSDAEGGLPGVHHLLCLARIPRPAAQTDALKSGWTKFKVKVGADLEDDVRRCRLIRQMIGPNNTLMIDANQRWDVDEAISWVSKLAEVKPLWIEEPTSPDDILGHATIAKALAPLGIGVATGEQCHNRVMFKQLLQASALQFVQIDSCRLGSVNENLAVLLMAHKFQVPVCPHAGGVGLCELVQHLILFDYICVSANLSNRMCEYVDHLHEHFANPVVIQDAHYMPPKDPGYSCEMLESSVKRHQFPEGDVWKLHQNK